MVGTAAAGIAGETGAKALGAGDVPCHQLVADLIVRSGDGNETRQLNRNTVD